MELIAVYSLLSDTDYEDATMLDFFTQDKEEIENDITVLYPIVASLTDGQRSGLDFVSLRELCCMAITDEDGYSEIDTDSISVTSVYDGVDREIYDKGGVALTSDAIRTDAAGREESNGSKVSGSTIALWCITGVCALACISSGLYSGYLSF